METKKVKSFTLSDKAIAKLNELAKKEHRSLSQVLDMIITGKLHA